jgi:serine/threonine protein kinase
VPRRGIACTIDPKVTAEDTAGGGHRGSGSDLEGLLRAPGIEREDALASQRNVLTQLFGDAGAAGFVGRYRLGQALGRGGMGNVYAAHDPELGRDVAVKILRSVPRRNREHAHRRFVREARAMSALHHPNVVQVLDAGLDGERAYLAMELLQGEVLGAWLRSGHRTPAEILDVFEAAGRGLAAAHAVGLVHRDFKPDNVMVTVQGIKVLDFGLVRASKTDDSGESEGVAIEFEPVTDVGTIVGTPRYMAPEQRAGAELDGRADQFSFCVALYEALAGEHPYDGDVTKWLSRGAPAPPPILKPGIGRAVQRVLGRGMRMQPAERYPSMGALIFALQAARRRRATVLAVGVAIAFVVVGLGTGAWIWLT